MSVSNVPFHDVQPDLEDAGGNRRSDFPGGGL